MTVSTMLNESGLTSSDVSGGNQMNKSKDKMDSHRINDNGPATNNGSSSNAQTLLHQQDQQTKNDYRHPQHQGAGTTRNTSRYHPDEWTATGPKIEKQMGEPVIVIDRLYKTYKIPGSDESVRALNDINLSSDSEFAPVRRGEFVILRGPSGGGKTSLLNILGTIDLASSGKIQILGEVIDEKSNDAYLSDLRLRRIGFVFQTFNLLATMSAFENVELPMTIRGKLSVKERKKRALELLTLVGLQDRVAHLPSELSGGEQQRVTIARALGNNPEI